MMFTARQFLVLGILSVPLFFSSFTGADEGPGKGETVPELVTRNQIQLNLAGAELIVQAAKQKASQQGWKMNIAVVDQGGHLLAFARMDGARPASAATALTKAVTAATFRQETGPLPMNGEPDLLLNISLQNAAAASGGKLTTLKGGVPIVVDGQVVGAVGIGGGSGEQDAEVAKAAIQTLLGQVAPAASNAK